MFNDLTFYIFSDFVNLVLGLLIGFFVFLKNYKNPIHRNFSYFCFGVSFWAFGHMTWLFTSQTPEEALFWLKFLMIGASLAPLFYFTFVVHFTHLYKKNFYFWNVVIGYCLSVFFILADIFSLEFISGSEQKLFFPFWPTAGPLLIPFLIFFFAYIIFASVLLVRYYHKALNLEKVQIKYIFFGIVLAFLGGSTNYFLFFDQTPIPPYLTILVSAYPLLIGYAITRYRFLSIKVILKPSLVYGLTFLISLAVFSLLLLMMADVFNNIWYQLLIVAGLFGIWHFVPKLLRLLLDRWWFSYDLDVTKIFSKIEDELKADCETENKLSMFLAKLHEHFHPKFVGIFLRDLKNDKEFRLFQPSPVYFTQNQYMEVLRISQSLSHPLILADELPMKGKHDLYAALKKSRVSVIIRIQEPEFFDGIIILGHKKNLAVWSKNEIAVLKSIQQQITSSLSWIMLYDSAVRSMKEMGRQIKNL